jgi:hypothetical protein
MGNNFDSGINPSFPHKRFSSENFDVQLPITPIDLFTSGVITQIVPIDVVNATLEKLDKESIRNRLLPAPSVVYLIMAMNLWRDTSQLGVLKNVCQGLLLIDPSFSDELFPTSSAISQARIKLGSEVMSSLADEILKPVAVSETIGAWYKGLRLMALDGTCFYTTDEKDNADFFGYASARKGEPGFPQCRAVGLVEVGTRAIVKATMGPYSDSELKLTRKLLESKPLTTDMLLLADRYYYSYRLWTECCSSGASLVWRVKKSLILPKIEELPDGSYISEVHDSQDKSQPAVKVRVIDYTLEIGKMTSDKNEEDKSDEYYLITNILDYKRASAAELAELYHERWEIETAFRELKTSLNRNMVLRSKKPDLVIQEIWGLIITHFAIRQLMAQAALEKQKDPDDLSFTDSLNAIKRRLPLLSAVTHPEKMQEWMDCLLEEIASTKCKRSKGKSNPRGVKNRVKPFPTRRRGQKLNQRQTVKVRIVQRRNDLSKSMPA